MVADGETGRLVNGDPERIAAALLQLADAPAWRRRLGHNGREAARNRTWASAMLQLAAGYSAALGGAGHSTIGSPVARDALEAREPVGPIRLRVA